MTLLKNFYFKTFFTILNGLIQFVKDFFTRRNLFLAKQGSMLHFVDNSAASFLTIFQLFNIYILELG